MVLLIGKIAKLYTKMENHRSYRRHHDRHLHLDELSLMNFQSQVKHWIHHLASKEMSRLDVLLSWIQKCFEVLSLINKAFAKLVVDIDYPISKWDDDSMDDYLKYSLDMLNVFNSINSSLSHLGKARLLVSHGVNIVDSSRSEAIQYLKKIQPKGLISKVFKDLHREDEIKKIFSGKEWILHQALTERNTVACWTSGVVLSALSNNSKPYVDNKNMAGGFVNSAVTFLDCSISEHLVEESFEVKEVGEINDAVACLVAASLDGNNEAAIEMHRKLEIFEKQLDGLGRSVDHLFHQVLAERNGLIDCFRLPKN